MNSLFTRFSIIIAFLTAGFGVNAQSISSTLNNRPGVVVNGEESFTVTLSPGAMSPLTSVKLQITLATPSQSANINLSLLNPQSGLYETLIFDGSGVSQSAAAPFFLVSPLSAKVTFTAAGTYNYSLSILNGTTNAVIANANESVVVAAPPTPATIASDLDGQNLLTGDLTDFDVTTTAGSHASTMVRVRIQLANAAQAGDVNLAYETSPGSGTFAPLVLNGSGMAEFGPVSGFPLGNITTAFQATFDAAGTYGYTLTVFEVANNNTLAQAVESVTVVDPTVSAISSTLDGQTLFTGDLTDFDVTAVAGSQAGTLVRVRIQLDNAAQAGDVNLAYETAPGSGTFAPLALNGAGIAEFGPVSGFPLGDATTAFQATFDAAGTYGYTLTIFEVAGGDTVAQALESVTVVDYVDATISSDLDGQTVDVAAQTDFDVTTTAGSEAGTLVRVRIQLDNVAQTNDVNISYETTPGSGTFAPLALNGSGYADFGPVSGFPLSSVSTAFRATFDAAGTYDYSLVVYTVAGNDTLAQADETVIVEDVVVTPVPTISSDLDARTGVTINDTEDFTVTTDADGLTGVNVRIKFTLDTPTQADDIDLRFDNPVSGNLESLTFDASGVAYAGAAAGFPIAGDDYDFTIEFLAGGTYGYTVALVEAANGNVVADNEEEVIVIDNSSINNSASLILGAFPNPTENLIQIQTNESGLGTLDVMTVTGSKVLSQTITGSVNTVSLAHLSTGVYIIRVEQAGNVSTLRVVKK